MIIREFFDHIFDTFLVPGGKVHFGVSAGCHRPGSPTLGRALSVFIRIFPSISNLMSAVNSKLVLCFI